MLGSKVLGTVLGLGLLTFAGCAAETLKSGAKGEARSFDIESFENLGVLSTDGGEFYFNAELRGDQADWEFPDGSYVNGYYFFCDEDCEASQTYVTIELRSDDYDTYLMVFPPLSTPLEDDDGAGGTDSRIQFYATYGYYAIVATSLYGGEEGAYRLSIVARPE